MAIDRSKEKLALMEEIGMSARVSKLKALEEQKAMLQKMMELKLKPTSEEKIKKQLTFRYWDFKFLSDASKPFTYLSLISFIFSLLEPDSPIPFGKFSLGLLIFSVLCYLIGCMKKAGVDSKQLSAWEDDIPYGATLAVKEAKEMGVKDFRIYFPITERSARLKADPIITGIYGKELASKECKASCIIPRSSFATYYSPHFHEKNPGTMVEIFNWDDGKIFE